MIVSISCAFSIDLDQLNEHLLRERITPKTHVYLEGLSADALPEIVNGIDFENIARVRNDRLFSFACIKVKQLQIKNAEYQKDEVLEKLTRFVRLKLEHGDVTFGPVAMMSLNGIEHPRVIELARELMACEHELTRDNATRLIEAQQDKLSSSSDREQHSVKRDEHDDASNGQTNNRSLESRRVGTGDPDSASNPLMWGLVLGLVALLGSVVVLIRSRATGTRS